MDWYDGPPNMTLGQAMASAPAMPRCPEKPAWDNSTPIYTNSELGQIYALLTENDRMMHTQKAGQCFVWNYVNQPYDEGFRLFTYRSLDGWGRISIQCRTMDTCLAGKGSRMYCGNWRARAEERGVRLINNEPIVLLDYDKSYSYGRDGTVQEHIDRMKVDVLNWWNGLDGVEIPAATAEELARPITHS